MENIASKEEMKLEAVKRMQFLGIIAPMIDAFEKREEIAISETAGIMYFADEAYMQIVRKVEETFSVICYHGILSQTVYGQQLSLFYVSRHITEWKMSWKSMEEGYDICFVENLSDPTCSKMGSIGFQRANGGLIRIW